MKSLVISKLFGNKMFSKHRNKMDSTKNRVNMDHRTDPILMLVKVWLHPPHPSLWTWSITISFKPTHQRTGI